MNMDAYEIHDARQLQDLTRNSSVASLSTYIGPVPSGKVWTVLAASYNPDTAETRTVHWQLLSRGTIAYALTRPVSIALSGTLLFPLLDQVGELKLFPGEYLYIQRDAATAGSVMQIKARVIENDLPYYSYIEPLAKVVQLAQKRGVITRTSSVGAAVSAPSGMGRPGKGEGRGGTEPI